MSRDTWKNKIYRAFVTNLNYYYLHYRHFHYPYLSGIINYDILILYLLFQFLLYELQNKNFNFMYTK